jgi:hypothetical protein
MGAGIVTQPSVPAVLRDLRKRIRILEARQIPVVPDHIVLFDKDPQNDDWLGLHVTDSQAFTIDGLIPIQVDGINVVGGIALTSVHDIWIGTTESSGGADDAGDIRIATSAGGDILIQTPQVVEVVGGIGAALSAGFATFSADATAAKIFVEDRGAVRPQEILAEVLYDAYAVRTPTITLRTDLFGDAASFNEVVVYGGNGGAGVYTQPGVYINLSDSAGIAGKFEIRDEVGVPLFQISRVSGGLWTYHIQTGATWIADL